MVRKVILVVVGFRGMRHVLVNVEKALVLAMERM
jgi:hypothetical protein